MTDTNAVIAMYDNRSAAEGAVKQLQKSGFDMKSYRLWGRLSHGRAGRRLLQRGRPDEVLGKVGAFWGGFWGLLFGAAFFWVPAIGPVLVGGPLAAWIVAGLENAVVVGGLSAIGARSVELRYTKGQYRDLRDRHKGGPVSGCCSWNCR